MHEAHRQTPFRIRCEWGLTGAVAVAGDVAIVVDVLSFTTALSVALDSGTTVFPYEWDDASAQQYAADNDATLAVARSGAGRNVISLSPASIRRHGFVPRLVLPSPNGSTICRRLATSSTIYGASLRSAAAVALHVAKTHPTAAIAVIAAGERWPGGELRPAIEDLWGAGAVIDGLVAAGLGGASPEAVGARTAFCAIRPDVGGALRACASGRELIAKGYGRDVDIAAELHSSEVVPALRNGRFTPTA